MKRLLVAAVLAFGLLAGSASRVHAQHGVGFGVGIGIGIGFSGGCSKKHCPPPPVYLVPAMPVYGLVPAPVIAAPVYAAPGYLAAPVKFAY